MVFGPGSRRRQRKRMGKWKRIFPLRFPHGLLLFVAATGMIAATMQDAPASDAALNRSSRPLSITLPDTPPFAIQESDGIRGLGIDILDAIASETGLRFHPQIASIPRIRKLILERNIDLALFIPMRWSEGIMETGEPLFCFSITLYSLKKNPVRNLDELRGRVLASLPGGMFSSRLRERTGVRFIAAKGDAVMARLLVGERVDAVVMGSHFARSLFDAERRRQKRADLALAPPIHLWTQPYVILRNTGRIGTENGEAIDQVIITLRRKGIIASLLKKHGAEQRPCPKRSASDTTPETQESPKPKQAASNGE